MHHYDNYLPTKYNSNFCLMNNQIYYQEHQEKSLWKYYVHAITRNYANFSGRARRREFWGFMLFHFLISYLLLIVGFIFFGSALLHAIKEGSIGSALTVISSVLVCATLGLIYGLVVFLPQLALTVRRLHDRGLSGWWLLAPIGIMFVGAIIIKVLETPEFSVIVALANLGLSIWLFVQYCSDSEPGRNQYGENPKMTEGASNMSYSSSTQTL